MAATDQVKDAAGDAAGKAKDTASNGADKVTGSLRKEILSSFGDVLGPAIKEMSSQSAEKLLAYAKEQGPQIFKEQALPKIMKSAGVDNPEDLAKAGVGKVGQMMSGSGGITGLAGKVLGKLKPKGGKGKNATGYGQGRRIMVQQHQYVPVNIEAVYRAWTTSEWPEYMHRVNTLDRSYGEEEGAESRYSIGVKGFWFKKNFTAQITECKPYEYIVWSTTQGNIKNTGRVSFHDMDGDFTLMVLNLDLAPSGLREKWVRGFRYHKRGIRSDFHRFAAWIQMRNQDQLDDMDGWLGTIEGGKITQTHDEFLEEQDEQDTGEDEGQEDMPPTPRGMRASANGDDPEHDEEADEAEDEDAEDDDEQGDPEGEADDETDDEADDDEDAEGEDSGEESEEPDEDEDDDEPEAEAEDDDEDEDEGDDYEDMSREDLRSECRERGLSVRGSRAVLIDRLREDDEDETDDEDEEDEPDEKPQRSRRRGRQPARR